MSHSECAGCHSSLPCNCCVGAEVLTPQSIANRPGLSALKYRTGTHNSFLSTMQARLASNDFQALKGLTTRSTNDPSMAMLDAWATVADVLTFYQERIANEGYLRTATWRSSVLELARLVGYALRPGVASSVYLAYTVDDNQIEPVEIPIGARTQSIPAPGELPQSFETSEKFVARREWNNLRPRMARPQQIKLSDDEKTIDKDVIYFQETSLNLKPNDVVLFAFSNGKNLVRHVRQVEVQSLENRTKVVLLEPPTNQGGIQVKSAVVFKDPTAIDILATVADSLTKRPSIQPASTQSLQRNSQTLFTARHDMPLQIISAIKYDSLDVPYRVMRGIEAAPFSQPKVYVFRTEAAPFGHNAPREPQYQPLRTAPTDEFDNPLAGQLMPQPWAEWKLSDDEEGKLDVMFLDNAYEQVLIGSSGIIQYADGTFLLSKVNQVDWISRSAYGISAKTTQITLSDNWRSNSSDIAILRQTRAFLQNEELQLADEPITQVVKERAIELASLYDGLLVGQWVIVSGERADIPNTTGITASEIAMIAGIEQIFDPQLSGDKIHSRLTFANDLAYTYKRETVKIYGNVIKATHGETRIEVLGSGDGSKVFQKFDLRQAPLTYLPATTAAGAASTLTMYVNETKWREADALAGLSNTAHNFITQTDDEGKTSTVFGDGKQGARLPSGRENVKATYRTGIGKVGNVKAEQISLLSTRPLGVKEVINPLRASGGADRESRDLARRNAPLAVLPLDRLVSVNDYEDFTRLFAGIGKASARKISDGQRQLVHVTIAGVDDIPIDTSSDLYRNLLQVLHGAGDPHLQIQLEIRELVLLVIAANITIHPDFQWEIVAQKIRTEMLDTFSFARRELGQSVYLSEVIRTMQNVAGVEVVDVDLLQSISEEDVKNAANLKAKLKLITAATIPEQVISVRLAELNKEKNTDILPAQIAFLSPQIPDTLILNLRSSQP